MNFLEIKKNTSYSLTKNLIMMQQLLDSNLIKKRKKEDFR